MCSRIQGFSERIPGRKVSGLEYQDLLDCCAEKNFSYGSWLLSEFGRTDDVRRIDGDLITKKSIIFAGRLEVSGIIKAGEGIKAGLGIEAGWGIKAGWGIEAGEGIEAGWGIEAGKGIKAGCEFGIYAGLRVRITSEYRKIIAKTKPENIMCGEFVEAENE